MVENVMIDSESGSMRALLAEPTHDSRGAVIVLHQAGGLSPQIAGSVQRLANAGYLAVGPDLFHRKQLGSDFSPMKEFNGDLGRFAQWLEQDDQILADLDATFAWLSEREFDMSQTAVLGFSWGGRAAFLAAANYSVCAAVSFYANGIQRKSFESNEGLPALADALPGLKAPWLGLYGGRDPFTPPDELAELASRGNETRVDFEVVVYQNSGHAFDVLGGPGPHTGSAIDSTVVEDSWSRAIQWISDHSE